MHRAPKAQLAAPLSLCIALLTTACADGAAPTAPTHTLAPAPVFAKGASSGDGATHSRTGILGNWWGGDPRDQLALMVGFEVPIAKVCATGDQTSDVSPGTGKVVLIPTGRVHFTALSREADVVVVQYGAGLLGPTVCPLVGAPVVATGTVKFTYRASFVEAGGIVAHATAEGVVDLAGGGQARLFAKAHLLVRDDGTVVLDEQRVRLTPL
jgi:hypothetical protein